MNPTHRLSRCAAALLIALSSLPGTASAQDRPPDVQAGTEVLTRGPVHEAFAEVVMFNPVPGPILPKAPPTPIEEVPPDQKPEGTNITWIPGYWAWDDDRNDFLWVSGIWRALPPGRAWVAGYWAQTGSGFQWMSGYWADSHATQTTYLPEPPASVEAGPNIAAPTPEHIWAPGCWVWVQNRYAWRPGYWVPAHTDWVWVPSHYTYCPRGYVYCEGYWDYAVESRGILFAPVYFEPVVYRRPAFRFSPAIVISLSVFSDSLFVRPSCEHYYFGDYYDRRYYNSGIYAAFSFSHTRFGYDPIYVSERYRHRDTPDWDRQVRQTFIYRRDHEEARPPRTFAAQSAPVRGQPAERRPIIAAPIEQAARNRDYSIKLEPVAPQERQQVVNRGRDIESYRGERRSVETPPSRNLPTPAPQAPQTRPAPRPEADPDIYKPSARPGIPGRPAPAPGAPAPGRPAPSPGAPSRPVAPESAKLPQSPVRAPDLFEKGRTPPSRPEPPRPDPQIQPRPNDRGRPEMPQANPRDDSKDRGRGRGGR